MRHIVNLCKQTLWNGTCISLAAYGWSIDRCRHQSAECSSLRRRKPPVPLFGAIVSVNVTWCVCACAGVGAVTY